MQTKSSFFTELQRRHVYKVGAMYCVAGWLLVQIVTQVLPVFHVSDQAQRLLVLVVIAGFPVALVLSWLFDFTPAGIVRTPEAAADSLASVSQRRGMDRKLNYVLGFLLLVGVSYLVAERLGWIGARPTPGNAVSDKSIAVLPFESLSDDRANAYFAVGIQDEILTRLAKIGALKVISRTSTAHYASSPDNLPQIASQLGVSAILEGSVQKAGDAVHVNVQLIRAASDEHLWAESYNRRLDDVFSVEGEVAQAIAEALNARLVGTEQRAITAKLTENPAAYEAYLHGLAHEGRFNESRHELEDWAGAYETAVRLDPSFAVAWAGLCRAYTEWYYDIDSTPQRLAQASAALEQAQRLAPDAAETWEAAGLYRYWGLGDYGGAVAAYGEALKRKPSAASVLYAMGNVRRRQGHWEEALELQRRAAALDPLNPLVSFNLSLTERALGRFDESQNTAERGLTAAPGDVPLLGARLETAQAHGDFKAGHAFAEALPLDTGDAFELSYRFNEWVFEGDAARATAEIKQALGREDRWDPGSRAFLLDRLASIEGAAGAGADARAHSAQAKQIIESMRAAGDSNPMVRAALALCLAREGNLAAAESEIAAAEADLAKDAMTLPMALRLHAALELTLGNNSRAIELLGRAQRMTSPFKPWPAMVRVDPSLYALRGEPGFEALTR